MPTYKKTTDIHSFHPTVIHATYLYSDSELSSDPQFQLHFDGRVTMSTLTGLPLNTLNKGLVKLNMTFPLVRECIQAIGESQCEVMSVIDL